MKAVVIYASKSGFTKKYAEWISKEVNADLFELKNVKADILTEYDTVIYGGGLYAVGINGIKFIKNNMDKLIGKKVAIYTTGATPYRDETVNEVRDINFTVEEQKHIRFFYMRGGFDYNKLKPIDKVLMTLLKLKIKLKKNRIADEKGMLAAYDVPVDFTREKNIKELIEYIRA